MLAPDFGIRITPRTRATFWLTYTAHAWEEMLALRVTPSERLLEIRGRQLARYCRDACAEVLGADLGAVVGRYPRTHDLD